jgi:TM2 domain-containing membrane protein YozV
MPIIVTCPSCSTTLKAPDAAAGKKVKCPKCTSPITVPAPAPAPVADPEPVEEAPEPRRSGGAVSARPRDSGAGFEQPPPEWQSNRQTMGIIAILLGGLGIHKFMLGITQPAIIMLVVWVVCLPCTAGLGSLAMSVIGIIEGIKYLQMSDAEFYSTYVVGKKPWL